MTTLRFSFYRLDTVISASGEVTRERVAVKAPVTYTAPGRPEPLIGFATPCGCPQAPACHAREAATAR
ncbi:hypothetical protein ABH941_007030 [Streptacidiphilus sp. EB103A]